MSFVLTVAMLLLAWLVSKLIVFGLLVRHTPFKTYLTRNFFRYDKRERLLVTIVETATFVVAVLLASSLAKLLRDME
jgi:hypothetical protein